MPESWQSGDAYERFMGRWSRLVAREFLAWLGVPPGQAWLDVGCGTGTLTRLVLECCQPAAVTGVDGSHGFITHARETITDPRIEFRVGLAQALELESNTFDTVVSGLVLNFVPDPAAALGEMQRVARPSGTVGVYVWDYAGGMQFLRYFWDAAVELDPAAIELDEGPRFPICQEGQLEVLFRHVGFRQVEANPIVVETVFRDFDDYWQPFLGGVGPASEYTLSLSPGARQKLEQRLRQVLPTAADGSISLTARAWAVKGTR